ncbi:hypothetical protein L0P88_04150 [Muricauda sp. SCSIO 64092]|uniref:hypothetical protein n=1 Tax=Allomuricauda sp. SCSIO 64092 TaxID=2908842 RepID=UPI001FF5DA9A|nr:hypothetical protein [Muricauda sp. SCSIO 64092]UOY07747.1 hypothetical protein L0P88_04150 [Muricauda sp. SCSIO 64092]
MPEIINGIIIQAKLVNEQQYGWILDCEGDEAWFPKSLCNFDPEKEELEAPKWLLQEKFTNERF